MKPPYKRLTDEQVEQLGAYLAQLSEGNARLEELLHIAVGRPLSKVSPFVLPGPNDPKIQHIVDWLKGAVNQNEDWLELQDTQGRRPKKLWQIGDLDRAHALANKAMAQSAHRLRSQFKLKGLDADIVASKIEIYRDPKNGQAPDLGHGYTLVKLLTPAALKDETAHLGHCIGNGAYDDTLNTSAVLLLSLRDANNKAHVTLEVADNVLRQMKGKENAPPVEKYMRMLHPFLKASGWELGEAPSHTGLIKQDGQIYDVQNLPDGFTYVYDLGLSVAIWLKKLPDNLSVRGDLNLEGCTGLTQLPDNLSVRGDLRGLHGPDPAARQPIGQGKPESSGLYGPDPAARQPIGQGRLVS